MYEKFTLIKDRRHFAGGVPLCSPNVLVIKVGQQQGYAPAKTNFLWFIFNVQ